MARRVSDTFAAGMITDVIGAPNSVSFMQDAFLLKPNCIANVGDVASMSYATGLGSDLLQTPSALDVSGWAGGSFHPNFGAGLCRGMHQTTATNYEGIDGSTSFILSTIPLATSVPNYFNQPQFGSNATEGSLQDQVILHAGVATAATAATGVPFELSKQVVNTGDEMIFAGEVGSLFKWGGSSYAAYKTGTVSVASASSVASRIVTGAGGADFSTAVQAGQYILIDTIAEKANTYQRAFRITKVVSSTQLEIETPIWAASYTGLAYRIQSCAVIQSPDGVWNPVDERPRQVGVVAYHTGKLFTAGVADADTNYNTIYNFDRIRWSANPKETDGSTFFKHLDLWHDDGYIDVFPGIGGAIVGLVSMGSELIIIKRHGLFRLTGSINYDGTGTGLDLQIISTEIGAFNNAAFALTKSGLVLANKDGLYLYDGEGLKSLTHGRIQTYWDSVMGESNDAWVRVRYTGDIVSIDRIKWDCVDDYFWVDGNGSGINRLSLSIYTSNDEHYGDYEFNEYDTVEMIMGNGYGGSCYDVSNLKMARGVEASRLFPSYPSLMKASKSCYILSAHLPLGEDRMQEGRVNNILAHLSSDSEVTIEVFQGAGDFADAAYSDLGGMQTGERNVLSETIADPGDDPLNGDYLTPLYHDRVLRIPVDGINQSSMTRLMIRSGSSPNYFAIYALGVDYEVSNTNFTTLL